MIFLILSYIAIAVFILLILGDMYETERCKMPGSRDKKWMMLYAWAIILAPVWPVLVFAGLVLILCTFGVDVIKSAFGRDV